jgi:hypothetical protein
MVHQQKNSRKFRTIWFEIGNFQKLKFISYQECFSYLQKNSRLNFFSYLHLIFLYPHIIRVQFVSLTSKLEVSKTHSTPEFSKTTITGLENSGVE